MYRIMRIGGTVLCVVDTVLVVGSVWVVLAVVTVVMSVVVGTVVPGVVVEAVAVSCAVVDMESKCDVMNTIIQKYYHH